MNPFPAKLNPRLKRLKKSATQGVHHPGGWLTSYHCYLVITIEGRDYEKRIELPATNTATTIEMLGFEPLKK